MHSRSLLSKMEQKFPSNQDGDTVLIVYSDGSGMIIRLGSDNIRTPLYDVSPRLLEFSDVDDLETKLKDK